MLEQHFLSVFEQVVGHLREEIIRGRHRVLCLTVGVCDRDTAGPAEGGARRESFLTRLLLEPSWV